MSLDIKKKKYSELLATAESLGIDLDQFEKDPSTNKAVDALIEEIGTKIEEAKSLKVVEAKDSSTDELTDRIASLEKMLSDQAQLINTVLTGTGTKEAIPNAGGFSEDQFRRLLAGVNDGKRNPHGFTRSDWVSPEDKVDPVTFFAPYHRYYLTSKPVAGLLEECPNNKPFLKWKNKFSWIEHTNSGPMRKGVSVYTTVSQKEITWIKSHPVFGKDIFLDGGSALRETGKGEYARLYKKHEIQLSGMSLAELTQAMYALGKAVGSAMSKDDIVATLADQRASEEQDTIRAAEQQYLNGRMEDRNVLAEAGVTVRVPA